MHIIAWIVFGLIAGAIAKALMPGRDPGGCIVTILLGIAGALVGGFLARNVFGIGGEAGIRSKGFFIQLAIAVVGAVIILALYRMIAGKRA